MDCKQCQCEHEAHFTKSFLTPHGNPGHTAGAEFHLDVMEKVKTPYGTFLVCRDCAKDCMVSQKYEW